MTFDDELRLSYLRYIREGRQELARQGLDDTTIRVAGLLFSDDRGWSISALAGASGLSRVTVRKSITQLRESGHVEGEGDYRLTETGADTLRDRMDAFLVTIWPSLTRFHRELDARMGGKT